MLTAPSWEHPFGTDAFGRDILTRIIYGARTALTIGFVSSFTGCSIGAVIGVTSAYFGGRVDLVIQRFIDILLSYPIIVLALVVVAVVGHRPVGGIDVNLILAIAIPNIPRVARVVLVALAIREMPYVDAARAGGYSDGHIIFRHMLPNVLAPYLIMLTAYVAQAILLEASLSFLGLGVSEPKPAWGLMLSGDSSNFYQEAPWMIIFPGAAISLAVFSFNLFGDSCATGWTPSSRPERGGRSPRTKPRETNPGREQHDESADIPVRRRRPDGAAGDGPGPDAAARRHAELGDRGRAPDLRLPRDRHLRDDAARGAALLDADEVRARQLPEHRGRPRRELDRRAGRPDLHVQAASEREVP
jgi:peptide/nickel transport system permease protein